MAAMRLCYLMKAEEVIHTPLWKRIICVHTQRLQKVVFSCPCPGEAFQGLSSPRCLQVPHVRWAGEGSKEGSEMGICIPSRAGRGEEGSYHPSSSHLLLLSWEKKFKRNRRFSLRKLCPCEIFWHRPVGFGSGPKPVWTESVPCECLGYSLGEGSLCSPPRGAPSYKMVALC